MMMSSLGLASLLALLLNTPWGAMATSLGTLHTSTAFASPANPASPIQLPQQHFGGTTRYASSPTRHTLHSGPFVARSMCRLVRQRGPLQARQTAVVARMSGTSGGEERRGLDPRHSSEEGGGSGVFSEFCSGVCRVVPALVTSCASAASAAEEAIMGDAGGGEMGARLDAPAAISFGAVVVAFAFLQARIRTAIKARTARREYEKVVKDMENQRLVGGVDEEYMLKVGERMSQLVREEQEARMVDIFGIPFNLVIPDGGGGGDAARGGGGATPAAGRQSSGGREGANGADAPSGEKLGIRETMRRKVEAEKLEGKAREDEITPLSTLKVAALWLVLISQLWLLVVLWNDPMGPATSAFLKD